MIICSENCRFNGLAAVVRTMGVRYLFTTTGIGFWIVFRIVLIGFVIAVAPEKQIGETKVGACEKDNQRQYRIALALIQFQQITDLLD